MLVCRDLVKQFDGKTAIDAVSFDVRRGEIVGLLGPNGAGKTTLIRVILDIFRPDAGEVRFLGRAMTDPVPAALAAQGHIMRDLLGYLPEERGLHRRGRLGDVLTYLAELHGLDRRTARSRVVEGLEAVGLSAYAERPVIELSKGMTQRAQLLAATLHRPPLLILDEPFSGLDPVGVQWAMEQIRGFQRDGATILLSAHQMAMVEQLCDRVVMISQGRRVLYGSLASLRAERAADRFVVTSRSALDTLVPDLAFVRAAADRWTLPLTPAADAAPAVLRRLIDAGADISAFTVASPTLEEIFLDVVGRETRGMPPC